jgi:hypothetical protein
MIQPVTYQRQFAGKSNAHLITFNDGNDYVVKFFQPGFEKSLANEWVAYCIGRYLGLPIPFSKIVDIPQEFIAANPELASVNQTPYQFASLYIPGCVDGHDVSEFPNIINHSPLAGIILFDYWLYNRDRTRKNILLRENAPEEFSLWAIDHSEIFGSYDWQLSDLDQLPEDMLIKSKTHEIMACFIDSEDSFSEYLHVIQTIPILLMEEIVELIPDEWQVTKEDKKTIVSTLLTRRKRVLPHLMGRFIKRVYHPIKENCGK